MAQTRGAERWRRVCGRHCGLGLASVGALLLLACTDPPGPATAGSTSDGTASGDTQATSNAAADSTGTTAAESSGTEADGTTGVDAPLPTPTLSSPPNGAIEQPIQTELCWNLVEDPEGELVRYRVFVDDIELSTGLQGESEGYEGPCVGPLTFDHEQTFAWEVQAFEAAEPRRASERSAAWSFTTEYDGLANTVFEDDFDADLGWVVDGDAQAGAWVRGDPIPATDGDAPSQPGQCWGGEGCYFTAQNNAGVVDDEDVAGGSTVLTSPPFDLSGAAAATVQLQRFFYKSQVGAGPELRVELLVPDARAPEGVLAVELERLETATTTTPHNVWTPREYVACGLPMVADTRLRITATDDGAGILEAAIDSVSVHAQDFATVCQSGEGGACDVAGGAAACPDPLLCCAQGTVNEGVHRCATPVAGLNFDAPTPTPQSPNDGPLGCPGPDLIIDESWIEPVLTDIFVTENTCELYEGCVGGLGWRTILRFTVTASNIGSSDLVLGVAANEPDIFHYAECHNHYHFDQFAAYELLDGQGLVTTGHKPGFCLLDSYSWAWRNTPPNYDCANQGISRGHADIYESVLPCQWIDVTDVAPGDYTLRAALNPPRDDWAVPLLNERRYDNNTVEVAVTVE
ncbi:MAG: hypothetical protein K0V04_34640 [Deltaproteobacteria bacterium]|nr:hypothetical protein [Deltaproteobacteria bacterium]